jgi:type 1 glutamine amidotransferase
MNTLLIALSVAAAAIAAEPAQKAAPDRVRVLIVTGVDYPGHLWQQTAPAIRKVLEQDKRFEVRIVEDPEFLASPAVADYDVIFLHFKNYQPLKRATQVRENLVNLVKQGKGLAVFHFACGAF